MNEVLLLPKRRPAAAMLGHAVALSCRNTRSDQSDAMAMRVYAGLRASVTRAAWMKLLAFSGVRT